MAGPCIAVRCFYHRPHYQHMEDFVSHLSAPILYAVIDAQPARGRLLVKAQGKALF